MYVVLTLSPRAESARGDLVAELAALLTAELLALLGSEKTLVLVHVVLVLLGTDDVGKDVAVGVLGSKSSVLAVCADLGNDALDGLLGAGVAQGAGSLAAALLLLLL